MMTKSEKSIRLKNISIVFIFLNFVFSIYSPLVIAENITKQEDSMFSIRKAADRGISERAWLKSAFTFSFADFYDAKHMNFRSLRVINEDVIKGGKGFDSHPHDNMEIITYVMSGALQHKDSMGNTSIIQPGEVQRMSAGTGIVHSEYNFEKDKDTHLYQIWIVPSKKGVKPSYAQKSFEEKLKTNNLVLVVSKNAREDSISIEQDADVYVSRLSKGKQLSFKIRPDRHIWIQMLKGKMMVNGQELSTGDGLNTNLDHKNKKGVDNNKSTTELNFSGIQNAEFMLFDLD